MFFKYLLLKTLRFGGLSPLKHGGLQQDFLLRKNAYTGRTGENFMNGDHTLSGLSLRAIEESDKATIVSRREEFANNMLPARHVSNHHRRGSYDDPPDKRRKRRRVRY